MSSRIAALLAIALCAVGCGAEGDGTDTPDAAVLDTNVPDELYVSLGTGFPDFESIDGTLPELPIIEGIQGGYHVWGGFIASGIDPDDLLIDFQLLLDGELVAVASYVDDLRDTVVVEGVERYAYAGVAVVFANEVDPLAVSGSTFTFSVALTDAQGQTLTDSTDIRAVCCEL